MRFGCHQTGVVAVLAENLSGEETHSFLLWIVSKCPLPHLLKQPPLHLSVVGPDSCWLEITDVAQFLFDL